MLDNSDKLDDFFSFFYQKEKGQGCLKTGEMRNPSFFGKQLTVLNHCHELENKATFLKSILHRLTIENGLFRTTQHDHPLIAFKLE